MVQSKINLPEYKNFSYIFRTDTDSYTEYDIMEEYEEWRYILTHLLGFQESYEIGEAYISSRLYSCLAKTGKRKTPQSKYGYITVNANYIAHHSNPDNFHSTLAHETIHTLVGCYNHGPNFKAAGEKLASVYSGIVINRLTCDPGYNKFARSKKTYVPKEERKYKYKVVCPKCGQIFYRERLSKLIKSPEKFRCGRCGGQFDIYEITSEGMEVRRMFIRI